MLQGSLVALVTPMTADAALAMDSLMHLLDWHIAKGSDGLVILGTTGESVTLTEEERRLVIHEVIRHVKKHAKKKNSCDCRDGLELNSHQYKMDPGGHGSGC